MKDEKAMRTMCQNMMNSDKFRAMSKQMMAEHERKQQPRQPKQ